MLEPDALNYPGNSFGIMIVPSKQIALATLAASLCFATNVACAEIDLDQERQAVIQIVQSVPDGWQMVNTPDSSQKGLVPLLSEYHITGAASSTYQRGQRRVSVKVFHFPNAACCYGAYTSLRKGSSTVKPRGDGSSEEDNSITFWQGSYLFLLNTTAEDDEEAKELMRSIADKLAQALTEHAPMPFIFRRLPDIDKVKGSERLAMGPISGKNFLPLPYVSFLKIESGQAAIADYQFLSPNKERLKLVLIEYADAKTALQAYQDYVGNLMGSHSCQSTANSAMFKMPESYLYCLFAGNRMMLISGAHKSASALMLSKQVRL